MLSSNLTVALFVKNEELRLREACRNFLGLFPLVVIDNFSTDSTVSVAHSLGLQVRQIGNPGHFENPDTIAAVEAQCRTDYLLIASCAEVVSWPLLLAYAEVANKGTHDVVRAHRISVTGGAEIPLSSSLRIPHPGELRMFRKGTVDFRGNQVHSVGRPIVPPHRILTLPQTRDLVFFQYRDYDCAITERNHGRYNDLWAKQRFEQGERFSLIRAFILAFCRFLRPYVLLGGWRFGLHGFIHCTYRAIMELTVQFRIWEHQQDMTIDRVRTNNLALKVVQLEEVETKARKFSTVEP